MDEIACMDLYEYDNSLYELPTVVVTGFGPFRNFDVNPSWVVVQELKKLSIEGVNLVICLLPVEYKAVHETVPKIWKEYNPTLVIHCGVSAQANSIVLEKVARNESYISLDVCGQLPPDNCCCKVGENVIFSKLDLDHVSQEVNQTAGVDVMAAVSTDAGRYLCEFTYYTSLNINESASAFIHIPPLDQPYSSSQLAKGLQAAIKVMLKQVQNK